MELRCERRTKIVWFNFRFLWSFPFILIISALWDYFCPRSQAREANIKLSLLYIPDFCIQLFGHWPTLFSLPPFEFICGCTVVHAEGESNSFNLVVGIKRNPSVGLKSLNELRQIGVVATQVHYFNLISGSRLAVKDSMCPLTVCSVDPLFLCSCIIWIILWILYSCIIWIILYDYICIFSNQ